jgi:hypothetical protein
MNDVAYGFATYLANAGFGTLGVDVYVGQIPENTNGLWVERIGGSQNNYIPMEEAAINIYAKSTSANDAIAQLDTIKRHIHRMHTTSFNGVEIYTMLAIGNVEDVSRDVEYAKIFKLTVQLTYRSTGIIS